MTARKERKVVTILFADLVGFTARAETLDPEDVEAILGPYHAHLRAELERFGGTVEKFIGDAVMAVFGAPVAHEDDPERAVRAALAIRDWAADEGGVEVRVAVNTGEALVSADARPEAGEAMVAGDVVNTAARLQAAAPVNGILAGETTYRATRDAIEYRGADPVEAKGKARRIAVWEARQARSRFGVDVRQHGAAPLFGRERELAVLTASLERARGERAVQLVTLVGVPGIGKSRLVYELFRLVDADPQLIYWRQGRSLPYGEGVSFWALSEMVKAHAGILEGDDPASAERKLADAVADLFPEAERAWVEGHLRPLVGLGAPAEADAERRGEAYSAWRRFLEGIAERGPLVLVFEDVHWADDGLLDFLDHLVDWAAGVPMLVLATARPELVERRPGWAGGKLNASTVLLTPLTDEDSARLVAALLERAVLPAEQQRTLLERAGGNPLYAEQFARLFLERGSTDDLPLPETVQGIIAARLDGLPQSEKDVLRDAAVLGKVFWTGALGRDSAEAAACVHALERKEFVRRERRSSVEGQEEYAFRHGLVRDVAYGQIPRARRAEKHRRAAEWIERLGRAEDHAELVAHHYLAAIELGVAAGEDVAPVGEPARLAFRQAGERASALNAFGSAVTFFEAALELWPPEDPERPVLLLELGRATYWSSESGDEFLEEAVSALVQSGRAGLAAEAEIFLADLAWHRGGQDATFEHVGRALDLVAGPADDRSRAFVLANSSRFSMLAGRNEEAIRLGRAAHALAEPMGRRDIVAHVLNNIGVARTMSGDLGGIEDLERSIETAKAANSVEFIRGHINLASVLASLGDLARAHDLIREAETAAGRLGLRGAARFLAGSHALLHYFAGRWEDGLATAETFIAECESSPHYMEAENRAVRALILLARGDDAGALEDSVRALELGRAAKDPQALWPALGLRLSVLAATGSVDEARAIGRELAETQLGGREQVAFTGPASFVLGILATGLEDELAAVLAGSVPTAWAEAASSLLEGDPVAAAGTYARIGSAPDEALARLAAARDLRAAGRRADADEQLRRSLAFWRSVGATRYVREGEALLAAAG